MERAANASAEHVEAFMSGFEFVLLAIRGRLADAHLTDEERADVLAFLADYERIARAYRARVQDAAAHGDAAALTTARSFRVELSPLATN